MAKRRAGAMRTLAIIGVAISAVLLGSLFVMANGTGAADGNSTSEVPAGSSNSQGSSADVLEATGVVPAPKTPLRMLQGPTPSVTTTKIPYVEGRLSVKAGGTYNAVLEYEHGSGGGSGSL